MSNRKLFWLVAAFALGTAGLHAQVFPGYLDTVIVPSDPANPSSTCFASSPCARIYTLGTSSAANMKCILPGGGACGYFGLSYYAGSWQLFTNPTASVVPLIQPTLPNNSAGLYLIPNGTAVSSQIRLYNSSDLTFTNTALVNMRLTGATAMIETVLTGAGTPATTFNIGELSGNALANFNIQFNGVTKHNFTPTKFTTPAIEITGTTSANCLATDSSGNVGAASSCGATLQTNGTNNSSQTTLNLQNGTNTTASNPSAGNVQVNVAAATASSLGVAQCDGTTITCSGGVITAVSGGSPPGMVRLAQQVLSSPAASVTFSGIAGTYSALIVNITARSSAAVNTDGVQMQVNADSTLADYSSAGLFGSGSGTFSYGANADVFACPGTNSTASVGGVAVVTIPTYAGTTFFKSATSIGSTQSSSNNNVLSSSWHWFSASAITSIKLLLDSGGNFLTGSTFTLYALQ